jgi:hypothetical protein
MGEKPERSTAFYDTLYFVAQRRHEGSRVASAHGQQSQPM